MLFLSGFLVETVSFELNECYQSELIDFEGEKDSEEDKKEKEEKEKEDKLLQGEELPLLKDIQLIAHAEHHSTGLSEEILEVLSPPPESI